MSITVPKGIPQLRQPVRQSKTDHGTNSPALAAIPPSARNDGPYAI